MSRFSVTSIGLACVLVACSRSRAEPSAPPVAAPPVVAAAPSHAPEDMSSAPRPRTEAELQDALARDVHDAGAWEELARLHLARSRERPAARLLAERVVAEGLAALARRNVHSVDLLLTRAQLALDAGAPLRAREALEAAVAIDPGSAPALRQLGRLCLDMRSFGRAREVLAALSEQAQGRADPEVWLALGAAERGIGNLGAAEDNYNRALKLAPADPRAFYNLGVLYYRRGLLRRTDAKERQREWLVARNHFRRFIELARGKAEFEPLQSRAREYIAVHDDNFPKRPAASPKRPARAQEYDGWYERAQRIDGTIEELAEEVEATMWLDIPEADRQARLRALDEDAEMFLCWRYNRMCEYERKRLLELERRMIEKEVEINAKDGEAPAPARVE
jgi:tetratricopeptide (TPR) repeat protein